MKEVEVASGPDRISDELVEAVARAIEVCTDEFESPVRYYVGREAMLRFEKENPEKDAYSDAPHVKDWDLESWKIIARAAIEAYHKATREGVASGLPAQVQDGETKAARTPIIDDPAPGKHVKVRGTKRNGDNEIMHGHFIGVIREVKRGGGCLVLDSGWHMNLDSSDELIWCADEPAPGWVK